MGLTAPGVILTASARVLFVGESIRYCFACFALTSPHGARRLLAYRTLGDYA